MWTTLLQVALGGALGATGRYLTGLAVDRMIGHGFPWGTLTVNVVGSFLMGALTVTLAQSDGTKFAPFLVTGMLGGFTTFSAFSYDAMVLYERGQAGAVAAYVLASVLLSIAGIGIGLLSARAVLS